MTMDTFECPMCGARYQFRTNLSGKKARCAKCAHVFSPEINVVHELDAVADLSLDDVRVSNASTGGAIWVGHASHSGGRLRFKDAAQVLVSLRFVSVLDRLIPRIVGGSLVFGSVSIIALIVCGFVMPVPGWIRLGLITGVYLSAPVAAWRGLEIWRSPPTQLILPTIAAALRSCAQTGFFFMIGSIPVWLLMAGIDIGAQGRDPSTSLPWFTDGVTEFTLGVLGASLVGALLVVVLYGFAELLEHYSTLGPRLDRLIELTATDRKPVDAKSG